MSNDKCSLIWRMEQGWHCTDESVAYSAWIKHGSTDFCLHLEPSTTNMSQSLLFVIAKGISENEDIEAEFSYAL